MVSVPLYLLCIKTVNLLGITDVQCAMVTLQRVIQMTK